MPSYFAKPTFHQRQRFFVCQDWFFGVDCSDFLKINCSSFFCVFSIDVWVEKVGVSRVGGPEGGAPKGGAPKGGGFEGWGFEGWGFEGWGFEGWGFEGWGFESDTLMVSLINDAVLLCHLFTRWRTTSNLGCCRAECADPTLANHPT